jgi:hypothetical protein
MGFIWEKEKRVEKRKPMKRDLLYIIERINGSNIPFLNKINAKTCLRKYVLRVIAYHFPILYVSRPTAHEK